MDLGLRGLDWIGEVRVENGDLLVEAPVERSAEINAVLARQGLYLAEIRPVEDSLESFFLEITQAEEKYRTS